MLSDRQRETLLLGTESKTIAYFQHHPAIAIFLFVGAIVLGALCTHLILEMGKHVFATSRLNLLQLAVLTLVWLIVFWILVQYVFRVPVTAVFTL